MRHFAEENGIPLSAGPRGRDVISPIFSCCQHIKTAKPQFVVCGTCEKLRKKSQDAVDESEIFQAS